MSNIFKQAQKLLSKKVKEEQKIEEVTSKKEEPKKKPSSIIKKQHVLTPERKIQLEADIKLFLLSIKGRASLEKELIKKMYLLHNEYFGTKESDYSCSICAARVYKGLKKCIKKS